MTIITSSDTHMLIRFDREEEVLSSLRTCAKTDSIRGTFTIIGAAKEVVFSYYDLEKKVYIDKTISEDVEVLGIIGNIAEMDGQIIIHAHGMVADKAYAVTGGHVKRLVVSATCEVALTTLPGSIGRAYDETTGLNLLTKK
jgi:predicted DNA-binding protein with PD1-like motif